MYNDNRTEGHILVRPGNCAVYEPSRTPSAPCLLRRLRYPASTNSLNYHQAHLRGPLEHLSYSSAQLEGNGPSKVSQEDANWVLEYGSSFGTLPAMLSWPRTNNILDGIDLRWSTQFKSGWIGDKIG